MLVLKGLKNLDKLLMAKRVLANVVDFDMHNLFRPRAPLENMEDADSGAWEVMPSNVLRERSYGSQPLLIRPMYKGDFLKKLDLPYEGKSQNIEAADPENLKDFTYPDEMLKHQEEPHPRVNLDEYYDYNRPGEGAGGDDLKEYWKRQWDPDDSPEMSEDKWLRMWAPPNDEPESNNEFFRASSIIANYLHQCYPIKACFDLRHTKTAKMLSDLEKSLIHGKKKLNVSGVSVRLSRAEPRVGRWTFATTSGKDTYATVFQFIPHSTIRDTTKLHARVSCSCPSFLFWGAQYHAVMEDYLYGKIRPKFSPPKIRDPEGTFLVCKHILACVPIVSKYNLGAITEESRKRIKKEPRFEVETEIPEEKLRIPAELVSVGKRERIKKIVDQWDVKPKGRRRMVMDLQDPEEVAYLAHRFPDTATAFVAQKLKQMAQKPSLKKEALKLLDDVKEMMGEEPASGVSIPDELKRFDSNPGIQETLHALEKKPEAVKRRVLRNLHEPESIAYIAHKMSYDAEVVSAAIEKLHDIIKTDKDISKRKKAENWLKVIIG
jgi:hypothetical protein